MAGEDFFYENYKQERKIVNFWWFLCVFPIDLESKVAY